MKPLAAGLCALALCATVAAPAHHSLGTLDIGAPHWVKGIVVSYRPGAPHALLELDAKPADGLASRWIMEGPFPGRMARIIELYGGSLEAYLKPGDVVEVCGFGPNPEYVPQRSYPGVRIDTAHFIHVQLIVMPDGQMRSWGPYGKLDNCVRASDTPARWREFLDRDALAHDQWCAGLGFTQVPSVAPPQFVEEVNRGLARPCR